MRVPPPVTSLALLLLAAGCGGEVSGPFPGLLSTSGAAAPPLCADLPATIWADDPGPGQVAPRAGGGLTIVGTGGADVIVGSAGPDFVRGGGGNDRICGEGGDDQLDGEQGDDRLRGGAGDDRLTGGAGADAFAGGPGADCAVGYSRPEGDALPDRDVESGIPRGTSLQVPQPTIDANGVRVYAVRSVFQGNVETPVRVLEPTAPAPGVPHRFVYLLPVQAGVTGLGSTYGDGLEYARLMNFHNLYNATLVAPSFAIEPWFGNHDGDPARRQESFVVNDLVGWMDATAALGEIPERWLIGFSKSGNGALFLLFRHPGIFRAAAAWDAPAQFTDMSAPCCSGSMSESFGSEASFDHYEMPGLVARRGAPFVAEKRIWISGDESAWTSHMVTLHDQMNLAGVRHDWVAGPFRAHHWHSGWVDGAFAALHAM